MAALASIPGCFQEIDGSIGLVSTTEISLLIAIRLLEEAYEWGVGVMFVVQQGIIFFQLVNNIAFMLVELKKLEIILGSYEWI